MPNENEVLTYTAAARRFSRSRRWAYQASKQGLLDKVLIPGHKRCMGVTAESVERLLRKSILKTAEGEGGAK